MEFTIVAVTVRSITIELDNSEIYQSQAVHDYYIDGRMRLSSDRNVVSIIGLLPDREYELTVACGADTCKKSFRTKKESVLLNVKKFGALGDGKSVDTDQIQAVISSCPADGTVYFPKGTYLMAPVFLKSHVNLWIDKEATLLGIPDRKEYPILPGMVLGTDEKTEYNFGTWEGNPLDSFASLLTAINAEDIDIFGEGVIDGNAPAGDWWVNQWEKRGAWRPNTIFLSGCKNVRLQGLRIQNSPSWTIHPYYSENLKFLNLDIQNPPDSPNTDGFNPESCQDVTLLGTRISVGDDCIAIKSGKYYMGVFHCRRTKGIVIRNCKLERGHGSVTIGSEVACGVENVRVSKCIFEGTDRGVRLKTRRGRGEQSYINDLEFENITMDRVHMPMTINMFYFCDPDGHSDYVQSQDYHPVDEMTPRVGHIALRNITVTGADASLICAYGLPEMPIESIEVTHLHATFLPPTQRTPQVPIMMDNFPQMSGQSFYLRNILKARLEDVTVEGSSDTSPETIGVKELITNQVTYN